ncbi:hypothetical protein B0H15DRAFT_951664 [Mycena belliarum]|uniref:Uncharacterized protein n=1 Tax=Mycena belliarum TaxID=1033014 RepID=A0AAD6TZC1_9AGAR|nr:hypothetical protein B0H15DRAFT_951664 [Mycena belliae]
MEAHNPIQQCNVPSPSPPAHIFPPGDADPESIRDLALNVNIIAVLDVPSIDSDAYIYVGALTGDVLGVFLFGEVVSRESLGQGVVRWTIGPFTQGTVSARQAYDADVAILQDIMALENEKTGVIAREWTTMCGGGPRPINSIFVCTVSTTKQPFQIDVGSAVAVQATLHRTDVKDTHTVIRVSGFPHTYFAHVAQAYDIFAYDFEAIALSYLHNLGLVSIGDSEPSDLACALEKMVVRDD